MLRWKFEAFIDKWLKPYRIFDRSGELYLARYRLIWTRWFGLYLHHIVQSDLDRYLHDHPWDFWAMIIYGFGYIEHQGRDKWIKVRPSELRPHDDVLKDHDGTLRRKEIDSVAQWRGPFRLIRHKAEDYHLVELVKDSETGYYKDVWTLFLRFRKRRDWGFWTPSNGWVSHKLLHSR